MLTPTILTDERLLLPIAPDAPAGVDLRATGDDVLDEILKAGGPRGAKADRELDQGEWGSSKNQVAADWPRVIALSVTTLCEKSKDLVVAARLAEGLLARHGFQGLAEGLWLLHRLLDLFWDGLYPTIEDDDDLEFRAQPFTWLNDAVAWRIAEVELPPEWAPFEEISGFAGAVAASREEFISLYATLDARFGRDAPRGGRFLECLDKVSEQIGDLVERTRPPEEMEGGPGADSSNEEPARRRPTGPPQMEPQDRDEALRRLLALSVYLRKEVPTDPLAYRLVRLVQWSEAPAFALNPPPQQDLQAPDRDLRYRLQQLETDSSWADLLEASEGAMSTGAGRFWLDLQRFVVVALDGLGAEYAGCAEAVREELQRYLVQFPELRRAQLADFTASAGPETQTWLDRTVLARPAHSAGGSERSTDESHEALANGKLMDIWQESQVLARSGRLLDALELLRGEIRSARCGREAFTWKLRLAELCIAEGPARLAIPLLEELVEQIDQYHLEAWEPVDLCARVFGGLYQSYRREGDVALESAAQHVFSRLCRLDVGVAYRYQAS